MNIYEEELCDDCLEQKLCRSTKREGETFWLCQDCHQIAQMEAQAAVEAAFVTMLPLSAPYALQEGL